MKPEDVPETLIEAVREYEGPFPQMFATGESWARTILAAALPAHERMIREQITRQATGMVVHGPEGVGIHCETCRTSPLAASGDVEASFALAVILGHATSPEHTARTGGAS